MKIRSTIPPLIFFVLLGACDEAPPDSAADNVDEPAEKHNARVINSALEALETDEVYQSEFWREGVRAGFVELGSWACVPPPPPPGCKKLPVGWTCDPV